MQALSVLQPVLVGLLTAAIVGAIARALSRTHARDALDGTRQIRPHTGLLVCLILGCATLSGLALFGAIAHDGGPAAWGVGLVFGGFGLGLITNFSPSFDVAWTSDAVTGPASYGMPPFGPRRARIAFDEIEDVGVDSLGSFFVLSKEGDKVRWNWVYRGHEDLNEAIAEARPDLFEEPDDS